MTALPIDEVIPEIKAALAGASRLVLAAPPGAGKTTRTPLELMDSRWLAGRRILLLEPRRIAARMSAERMATSIGEKVGGRIGLTTRVDRRTSAATRIEVITDGIFTRRILADPALDHVGAVFFDEFHERSLNLDLGLALARDAQQALRDDLRLIVMSATLDVEKISAALDATVIASEGKAFPVETFYLGRTGMRIEDQTARAITKALAEQDGSVLVFLPGIGEIRRTAERIDGDLPDDVMVAPLYGALSPTEQDMAVSPAPKGKRKIVLATDIAESALTIEGVSTVIDAGLARIRVYDRAAGGSFLETRRASRASADQRRGRAGRLGPGACYRLWDEEGNRGLAAAPTPEILNANLSGLVLALAEWGEKDWRRLSWIDPPPARRMEFALGELQTLGALDDSAALTAKGRAMAALPLEPRLAAMVACADDQRARALAAEIAALIGERGLGGRSIDIRDRIERFRRDNSQRARTLAAQAARWAGGAQAASLELTGAIIAAAFPHLIAKRKGPAGAFQLASGTSAILDTSDPLSGADWLAVADLVGAAASARITAAAPIEEKDALQFGGLHEEEIAEFDLLSKSFRARRVKRLGAIILHETPLPTPAAALQRGALIRAVQENGFGLLAAGAAVAETIARLALLREHFGDEWPQWSEDELLACANEWLAPLFGTPPALETPTFDEVRRSLAARLDWSIQSKLAELAPLSIETPAGRKIEINYLAEGGPLVEARAQEFYGLGVHPAIAGGRVALSVSLLSPARRQVALTKNLPAFWKEGYQDMAKDMRGRYPKHDWPGDPASARAHEGRTKARLKNEAGGQK